MKHCFTIVALLILTASLRSQTITAGADTLARKGYSFFRADHPGIDITGRVDLSNPQLPRFWQPGVYIRMAFSGSACEVLLNDEMLWGNSHNYVQAVVDGKAPVRIKTVAGRNTLHIKGLKKGRHTLLLCKATEAGIGYLELAGIKCKSLLAPAARQERRIEFIGNSITCGMGADLAIPCGSAQWYDQHNAYDSYGPLTARALGAEWQLSAVSGIGLIHSCCNMEVTMPQVYDKINMREDTVRWDFARYRPGVVTVCLGQNDGIQDSALFCAAYVRFIDRLRAYYPDADIICLTSPMADEKLLQVMKAYLQSIVAFKNAGGDTRVHRYFYTRRYHNGCGDHPDLADHRLMAAELTAFIRRLKNW